MSLAPFPVALLVSSTPSGEKGQVFHYYNFHTTLTSQSDSICCRNMIKKDLTSFTL